MTAALMATVIEQQATIIEQENRIAALKAVLRTVIDNVETGSYESTGQAIEIVRAALDKDAGK